MSHPDAAPIYEVRAETPNGQVHSYGVRRTRAEADTLLRETSETVGKHHTRCWVEQIDTTGFFVVPPTPKPRDRFTTRVTAATEPGTWQKIHVEVLDGERVIGAYDRNYGMLQTFEPFRQNDRMFALISTDYTATSVMDLRTGEIVAAEEPHTNGFCPVGFYVPDWWDVHNGRELPGSMYWRPLDDEWPTGDFGFVWGCVWGTTRRGRSSTSICP